jgi:effector-binding domain-containing protein
MHKVLLPVVLEAISKICFRTFYLRIFLLGEAFFAVHTGGAWTKKTTKPGRKRLVKKQKIVLSSLLMCLAFSSCRNEQAIVEEDKKVKDSVAFYKHHPLTDYPAKRGVAGIYDVPELLTLCKLDSVPVKEMAQRIRDNFSALEKDLEETGAEVNGPQGIIYYNNSPDNFKFECVWLIKQMPAKNPQHSTVVALEADKMLLYNYYGSYESTFSAYDVIRKYFEEHNLEQSGPMREFYSTDVLDEKDSSKWLTRIMVPVTLKKDKK